MAAKSRVGRVRQVFLLFGDIICYVLGLLLSLAFRYGFSSIAEQWALHRLPFAIIFAIWLLSFYIAGLYTLQKAKNQRDFFTLFFSVFSLNAAIAVLFFYFIPYFSITPKTVLFLDLIVTLALLFSFRVFFNSIISLPPLKLALIGSGSEVNELLHDLKKHPQRGYECVLHLTEASEVKNLPDLVRRHEIDAVAVAIDHRRHPELQKSLFECIPLHIQFFDFVDFYEQHFQKVPLAVIDQAWFLENLNEPGKEFFSRLKRAIDILVSISLGVIGLILTPFIAFALLLNSGRPILFQQMRVSQFEKPFRIFKFRSMLREGEDDSITAVGRFLRATHLDEIPQLWNIFVGEMSFIGPRPEKVDMVSEFKKKIPFYSERLLIRPGITGWAQLHEPHAKAEDALQKLQYDLFYIKHRSLLLDLEIILKTLRIMLT